MPSKSLVMAQVVQQLLQRGAKVDAQDSDGQTPLHYASLCKQGEVGHLQCFLCSSERLIWVAVTQAMPWWQVCSVLLHGGADDTLRDKSRRRPQDMD